MACGPPMAPTTSGKVMNGPTPIMSIMFSTVASFTDNSRASCGAAPLWASVGCMACADQIDEETDRAGDAGGELAEEGISGVDVKAFAVTRGKQSAAERLFAGVVAAKQGLKIFRPAGHEVHAALLHPSVEILFGDLVRRMEQRTVRVSYLDGSGFVADALAAE